jgi:MoaA/NifB/PqqE/SkfB family radical SAM enzyme
MINKRLRYFVNDDYELFFDTKTGFEMLRGIKGKEDPFYLVLPSLLDIGIMGTCKNKCNFCYQGHINRPNMKLNDFKRVIDEVSYHTNQVALGGRGDPNHHPNFKEMLEYCRKNNVIPNYTTSGIDITDEQIEISKMCGAVAVSQIFSEQKIKVRVRRKDNDEKYEYKEIEISNLKTNDFTFNAIQTFIDFEIKTNIHFIYSKLTHDLAIDILKGKDVWKGKVDINKLNAVIFLLFKPHGAGKNLNISPTSEQLNIMANKIFSSKAKFKIGIDSCLANHITKHTKLTASQKLTVQTCEASRMSAYISPNMKILPCSFADEKTFGKQINNIHKLWNNSKLFVNFRKQLLYNENKCPLKL